MKNLKDILIEGSWGYKPMDGDQPLDIRSEIVDNIFKYISDQFDKIRESFDVSDLSTAWSLIGNTIFFLDILYKEIYFDCDNSDRIECKCFEYCKEFLNRLESSEDWINSWEKPEEIRKSIKATRNKFAELSDKIHKRYK